MDELQTTHPSDSFYEELCTIANNAARKYVTLKVSDKGISDFSVSVCLEESEGMNIEEKRLAEEAVKAAFDGIHKYVSDKKCQLKT